MKHALLSPSSASRWLNCTPAPRLEAELPDSTSEYAAEGTLAHSVCELFAHKKFCVVKPSTHTAALKRLKKDALWQGEMEATAQTYVDHLLEHYMAFTYKPYIAFEVKVDITDYVPEAFGTCDCVMIGGDQLIITDYKHGLTDGMGQGGTPVPAERNAQMMLYALGALKVYRPIYGDTIKKVSMYIDQPRLDSYDGYCLTVAELLAWGENEVKPKAAAAFAGVGDFVPGGHCHFCRAKAQCRARADAHTALEDFKDAVPVDCAGGIDPNSGPFSPLLTNAEVGALLVRGKTLVDWYDGLKEYALTALLDGKTISGWKAVEGRSLRQWADQDKALEAIITAGHPREIVYETVPKTLAQLEKVIGVGPFAELVGDLIIKPPGKPALAMESDKRPVYSSAAADFKGAATT